MKSRLLLFMTAGLFAVACAGDSGDAGAAADDAEPAATAAVDSDAAAIAALEAVRAGYAQHYNLHHASMVADYYAEDALAILADGTVGVGREAIAANLEGAMAGSPTLTLTTHDQMIFGDRAVSRGGYSVEVAPEGGEAMVMSGNFMSLFNNVDGEWKLGIVLTNYDAPPPEGAPLVPAPEDGPPPDLEASVHADLTAGWAQHYNLGHPSMVADYHTEDGAIMFANGPLAEGRAAIEAAIQAGIEAGSPQIGLHEVEVEELGDGWALGLGWYEMALTTPEGDAEQSGAYLILTQTAPDGSRKIHWSLSNGAW